MKQVAIALAPMIITFAIFQVVKLRLKLKDILKISVGTIYTYAGLVLFFDQCERGLFTGGISARQCPV